jgi:hypothetical protein
MKERSMVLIGLIRLTGSIFQKALDHSGHAQAFSAIKPIKPIKRIKYEIKERR